MLKFLIQLWELEATLSGNMIRNMKMGRFVLFFRFWQVGVILRRLLYLSVDRDEYSCHFLHILWKLFWAGSYGISLRDIAIVVFVLFYSVTVGRWVSLFYTLVALLILPIIFIKGFILYLSFIISASSVFSFTSIYLWKIWSFGCR